MNDSSAALDSTLPAAKPGRRTLDVGGTPAETYPDDVPLPPGNGRCTYRFPSGPRCRKFASQIHPYLCEVHFRRVYSADHGFSSDGQPRDNSSPLPGFGNPQEHPSATAPVVYDPSLAAELIEAAGDFSTAGNVNRVMRKVFQAMVERRLSPKEAGILCYIAQTILHTHRAIAYQKKLDEQAAAKAEFDRTEKLTWNLPR